MKILYDIWAVSPSGLPFQVSVRGVCLRALEGLRSPSWGQWVEKRANDIK
jgi:hypothetical protein